MTEYRRTWNTRDLEKLAPEQVASARESVLVESRNGDVTRAELIAYRDLLARNDDVRASPFGAGGDIEIIQPRRPKGAARRDFALRTDQFVTRTDEVHEAIEWMRGLGGDASVIEHDQRLGVTLMEARGVVGRELYDAMVALADHRPARRLSGRPPRQRLSVGPNDIAMRAWKVKSGSSPQPTKVRLGDRPTDTGLGKGITVAVIDGGFETSDNRRTDGWDDLWIPPSEGDQPLDMDKDGALDFGAGHGTFVSGVVSQVAPDVVIRQYRGLDSFGFGNSWRVKDCIEAAIDDGCNVINLSLGSDDPNILGSPAVSACLHRVPAEIAVVAAAGNDGIRFPPLPAASTAALAIGALDLGLLPESWSNYGTWVDAATVGTVVSTFVRDPKHEETNPVRVWSGTSFATPQVSGYLAIQLGRGLTVAQAWDTLRDEAQRQTGNPLPEYGHRLRIL